MTGNSHKKRRFGVFEFDPAREELRKQGLRIKLQGQPLRLLAILLERPGEVVTREELQTRLWDQDVFVDFDHSLNKAVSKIREALGDSAESPRFVETLSRRGYRFIAPVQEIEETDPHAALSMQQSREGVDAAPARPTGAWPRLRDWGHAYWKHAIAVVTIVLVAFAVIPSLFRGAGASRSYAIAVLPFENIGDTQDVDYLSDGLGESVIHALSRFNELRVMSRNSSFRYKGQATEASTVGRELGVGVVLTGRIRTVGDKIRISVDLVDATDNHNIWGERFERKASELAGIENEIAAATVKNLRFQVPPQQNVAIDTQDSEAFRLYLQGNYSLSKITEEQTLKAIQLFQRALDKDPHYALAWAGLAHAYGLLPYYGTYSPAETLNKSREATLRALELNPNLAEAHVALASIREDFDWDWDGAETEYKKAIALNPSYSVARHWYSHFLSRMGRHEEGIAEAKRAVEVDPLSPPVIVNLAASYVFARRFDEAMATSRRAIALDPTFPDAHYVLGICYREEGHHAEGIEEFRRQIASNNGNKYAMGFLGYAYAISGRRQEAEQTLKDLRAVPDVSPLALALVYAGLQKDQAALQLLEKAFTARDPYIRYLKVDPCFERLRPNPRFQALLKRAKLISPDGSDHVGRSLGAQLSAASSPAPSI